MNAIFEFYNSVSWAPVAILLAFWLFWPGTFFLVGYIGESRIIPLGKGQSVMFFPGDLALGVIATAFIGLAAKYPAFRYTDLPWLIACLGIAAMIIMIMRFWLDAPNYQPRSANSPTKWLHDLVGYGVFPFIGLWLGLPQLLGFINDHNSFGSSAWPYWLVIFLAAAFFIICINVDLAINGSVSAVDTDALELRHPSDWQPIWVTRRTANAEHLRH